MNKNLGTIDRVIRIVLAIGISVLILFSDIPGTAAIMAGTVAFLIFGNGLIGDCGIDAMFGISTKKTCAYRPGDKTNV